MKAITIHCPKCKEVSDLYLGSEAFMIVLNCPNPQCGTPLIYYYGKTSEATDSEMARLQDHGFLKNAGGLLREISKCGVKLQGPKKEKPFLREVKRIRKKRRHSRSTVHPLGKPIRAEYFTRDDLVDLKIELETCKSVQDFLSRI